MQSTHATMEVHHFSFEVPQFGSLSHLSQKLVSRDKKNCYGMKNPMAEVRDENHANKNGPFPTILG